MAAPDLTTLALVKTHAGITAADDDTILQELLTSVSEALQGACRRTLAQVASVVTVYRPAPGASVIVLDEWPNATPVVTEDSTALVNGTDYEIRDDRLLVRISGDRDIAWAYNAKISVTMHEGYATVPADLALACREQTRFAFQQTKDGGNRLGTISKSTSDGAQTQFNGYEFLPSVVGVLRRYVRGL